jgi:hypothetical protein
MAWRLDRRVWHDLTEGIYINKTMMDVKNIMVLIVLVFASNEGRAQNSTTTYDTCQYATQCVGEWQYAYGLDTIRITLRHKRDYSVKFNYMADNLYGWIEYKQGNTIIESTYTNRNINLPYEYDAHLPNLTSAILGLKGCNTNSRVLEGSIIDYHQAKETHKVTATVNNTNTQMTWKQSFNEGHGAMTGAYGMTLPREFILTRQ